MNIIGVDYSLTSPAICIYNTNNKFSFENCTIFSLTGVKRAEGVHNNVRCDLIDEWTTDQDRYNSLMTWVLRNATPPEDTHFFIEGYSFNSSTGRVFNIAENTGCLKQQLWALDYPFDVVAPTVVKKLATGKGNANKQAIEAAFIEQTGVDLRTKLDLTPKMSNPISDIIDAYYVCKYGVEEVIRRSQI